MQEANTFQAVLATDGYLSYVFFIYCDIEWGAAEIGFNAGDGSASFSIDPSDIETGSNVGIPGVYIYQVDYEIIEPSGKILEICTSMAYNPGPYYTYLLQVLTTR